jgi:hypothetical protein
VWLLLCWCSAVEGAIAVEDDDAASGGAGTPRAVSRSRWGHMFLSLSDGGTFPLTTFPSKPEAAAAVADRLNACIAAVSLEPLREVLGVVDEREFAYSGERFQWWLASGGSAARLYARGASIVREDYAPARRFRGGAPARFGYVLFESE